MNTLNKCTHPKAHLILSTLLLLITWSAKALDEGTVIKSPNDHRKCAYSMLENEMQVMVVSDPSVVSPTLALSIGVAHFQILNLSKV